MRGFFGSRTSLRVRNSTKQREIQSLPSFPNVIMEKVHEQSSKITSSRSNPKRTSMKRLRRSKSARKPVKERKEIRKEDISSPRDSSTLKILNSFVNTGKT